MLTLVEPPLISFGLPASTIWSPCLAAGKLLIKTLVLPLATTPPTWGLEPSDFGHTCVSTIALHAGSPSMKTLGLPIDGPKGVLCFVISPTLAAPAIVPPWHSWSQPIKICAPLMEHCVLPSTSTLVSPVMQTFVPLMEIVSASRLMRELDLIVTSPVELSVTLALSSAIVILICDSLISIWCLSTLVMVIDLVWSSKAISWSFRVRMTLLLIGSPWVLAGG